MKDKIRSVSYTHLDVYKRQEVIGANVKEKGTANGAITDMNGVFHLKVSNLQKAVLQISFMGHELVLLYIVKELFKVNIHYPAIPLVEIVEQL